MTIIKNGQQALDELAWKHLYFYTILLSSVFSYKWNNNIDKPVLVILRTCPGTYL